MGVVIEGDFDDVFAYLEGYFVLGLALVDYGCDGVLAEDDGVAWGRVVVVLGDDWGSVVVEEEAFSVFLGGGHAAHVDCVVVVAEIFVWASGMF